MVSNNPLHTHTLYMDWTEANLSFSYVSYAFHPLYLYLDVNLYRMLWYGVTIEVSVRFILSFVKKDD